MIKRRVQNDFNDFLARPTNSYLRALVDELLTYQTSFLLGPKRKGWQAHKGGSDG